MKNAWFQMRLEPERKLAWEAAAGAEGLTLAGWVGKHCDLAAGGPVEAVKQPQVVVKNRKPVIGSKAVSKIIGQGGQFERPGKRVGKDMCQRCQALGLPSCKCPRV